MPTTTRRTFLAGAAGLGIAAGGRALASSSQTERLLELQAALALIWACAEVEGNGLRDGVWIDTSPCTSAHPDAVLLRSMEDEGYAAEAADCMACATEYLFLRGFLETHPSRPELVRLVDVPDYLPLPVRS